MARLTDMLGEDPNRPEFDTVDDLGAVELEQEVILADLLGKIRRKRIGVA
ncbi:hypothetical protein [Yoonia sp.]|nr:hypothetical protein [Yoonia sp.]MDE0850904.1 hypothetical protein [Yoonia sp.]